MGEAKIAQFGLSNSPSYKGSVQPDIGGLYDRSNIKHVTRSFDMNFRVKIRNHEEWVFEAILRTYSAEIPGTYN